MRKIMKVEDIFGDLPTLETKRLILRKMSLDDAHDMFEFTSDPEVVNHTSLVCHKSTEDSKKFLKIMLKKYKEKKVSPWGIIYKENKKFIGACGYIEWWSDHARAEIGFFLSRKYWNRRLMTEVVKEVIKFGFEKMKLNRIEARCFVANIASEKFMQKLGMKYEGIQREGLFAKGKYHDLKVYSIMRREYYGETAPP